MKIISIDDSKSVHAVLDSFFNNTNVKLHHALDALEALDLFQKDSNFDLVFLDWEMPKMTGLELLKILSKKHSNLPVVMMTTKSEPNDILECLKQGAKDFVMKPFTEDILFQKIEMITNLKVSKLGA